MKTGISITGSAIAVAAAVALLAGGCTDSGVVATTDSSMRVTANPSTVVIDPNEGEDTGTTQLDALILESNGFPASGISLVFRTSAGTLASGGAAIETDANGVASDTLTLSIAGPSSVTVDAISGNLDGTTTVTVSTVGENIPPIASFFVSPSPNGWVNEEVTFDGSASNDPDGAITCHQWDIEGGARIIQAEGPPTTQTHTYTTPQQNINVTLRVSDDPDVGAACTQGNLPPGSFNGSAAVTQYEILERGDPQCGTWPIAEIASQGGQIRVTIPPGETEAVVTLDGSGSRDTATPPRALSYTWACGISGETPVAVQGQFLRTCTYSFADTYQASLYVNTGLPASVTDPYCRSNQVFVDVIISNPPPPEEP